MSVAKWFQLCDWRVQEASDHLRVDCLCKHSLGPGGPLGRAKGWLPDR